MKRLLLVAVAMGALALTSVALAAAPRGTYRATIHASAYGGVLDGSWSITLSPGHYRVAFKGKTVLEGKDSVHGSTITVGGGGSGAYCQVSGTYRFQLHGKALRFTAVKDPTSKCGARKLVLTQGHFTKV
jgi:hypothetical protein